MANFISQAARDVWDIFRRKLPESFGYEWDPTQISRNMPIGLFPSLNSIEQAAKAARDYLSAPTFSQDYITNSVRARLAMGGIGDSIPSATPPIRKSTESVAKPPAITPSAPAMPPTVKLPEPAPAVPRGTEQLQVPTVPQRDILQEFARRHPDTRVVFNGQMISPGSAGLRTNTGQAHTTPTNTVPTGMSERDQLLAMLDRAIQQYGKTGRIDPILRNAVGRPDISGGIVTSIDPATGRERLLMASYRPQQVSERIVTAPYLAGESPEDIETKEARREAALKLLRSHGRFIPGSNAQSSFGPPKSEDLARAEAILNNLSENNLRAAQLALNEQAQQIAKERLALDKSRFPIELEKAKVETQALKERAPHTVQGYAGEEHRTLVWNPKAGRYEMLMSGTGPKGTTEETSPQKLVNQAWLERYKKVADAAYDQFNPNREAAIKELESLNKELVSQARLQKAGRVVKPTLQQWMAAMRGAGSQLTDEQLRQAYFERYGR